MVLHHDTTRFAIDPSENSERHELVLAKGKTEERTHGCLSTPVSPTVSKGETTNKTQLNPDRRLTRFRGMAIV